VKYATILEMDKVFGLGLGKTGEEIIPKEVEKLAVSRREAREKADFGKADEIREEIEQLGWKVVDKPNNNFELEKIK